MAKHAVCVGINDYPGSGNDLSGCVNDAKDWASLLKDVFGFEDVKVLLDAKAKRQAIVDAMSALVTGADPGDVLAFTYSGHGTWVYDTEDPDEADNRDEAWFAHDGILLDDTIRSVILGLTEGARLTVISDSCHSGGVTRAMLARTAAGESPENAPKPRYLPPEGAEDAMRTMILPVRKRMLYPESTMDEILLSGCNSYEYSYDAYINGRFNGAMTATSVQIMRADPGQTYAEFHRRLREHLPSARYPQSPQLEGSEANRDRPLFT